MSASQSVSPPVYLTEFLQKDRQTDSQAVIVTNQRPIEMLKKDQMFLRDTCTTTNSTENRNRNNND